MPGDDEVDLGEPYNVTKTEISCPFDDGTQLPIEIGWVNRQSPMLNVNAPEVLAHLRAEHNHV